MDGVTVRAAEEIWRWLPISDEVKRADLIFVLGSISIVVPVRAAELYQHGYAPLILATGGFGNATKRNSSSEADLYAKIMDEQGVPQAAILIENRSSNTGENIRFSQERFRVELQHVRTSIAVATPLYSRRQKAALQKQWSSIEWQMTTPSVSSLVERTASQNASQFLCLIVGEVDRLEKYPAKGFTVEVPIPSIILEARDTLVGLGYDQYAVKA